MSYFVRPAHLAPKVATLPTPDASLPRACIIGAGSSGLAAAKALALAGVPFDCFEQGSDIGGNWKFDNSNGQSACYDTLEINTSRQRMAFSDFPMPKHYPAYARHDQVHDYFEAYAAHFGFRDRITFNTKVTEVTPDPEQAGKWLVTVRGDQGETTTSRYDAVLVANGHHWDPRLPDPAYPGTFTGGQIHAHEYRSGAQLEGKDVVVVGAGNSAMDISVEGAKRARSVHLSIRRGEWVLKKWLLGIPVDWVRFPGWAPWWATRARLRIGAITSGAHTTYGLPKPRHAPGESHPVQSDRIRAVLAKGQVTAKPGIERFDQDHVVFTDGSRVHADLVVWATGYRVTFPFFDPELLSAPGNDLPLWHRTVHPDHPGLFFIGLLQPVGAVMPLAEAQANWVAEMLTGAYTLPATSVMRREMRAEHERYRKRFYDSPRHTMEVDFDRFLWELGRERRRGANRAPVATGEPRGPLRGRVIAVAGGAQGIGLATAERVSQLGAHVVIGDLDASQARAAAQGLAGSADAVALDVTDPESCVAFLAHARNRFGPVDIVINSAGVMWVGPFLEEPAGAVARQVQVNLVGAMNMIRAAVPDMRARGRGRIITLASAASLLPTPGEATYAATKHGLYGFSKAVREELRGTGVRLSLVMPTVVDTALAQGTSSGAATRLSVDQVAEAVVQTIRVPKFVVTVPRYVAAAHRAVELLPERLRDAIYRRLVPNQLIARDDAARNAYESAAGLHEDE